MKTTLLLGLLSIWTLTMDAQSYDFSVSNGTYTDLSGSTSLNDGKTWDDPNFRVPIDFDFMFFNESLNEIYITDWGLGGELSPEGNILSQTVPYLSAFGSDVIDRGYDFNADTITGGSLSNLSYAVEGTTGSRILKIEWNNVGFYSDLNIDLVSSDFINFQLWLYEGSNDIEIHFGPQRVDQALSLDSLPGTYIGLFPAINADTFTTPSVNGADNIVLTGNPNSPTAVSVDFAFQISDYMNGVPSEGTIYKFTMATPTGIYSNSSRKSAVNFYPNPAINYIEIAEAYRLDAQRIDILSINGQLIKQLHARSNLIDVSDLTSGNYVLQIRTDTEIVNGRFFKQ